MANIKTTIGSQGVVSTQVATGGSSTLNVAIPVNLTAYSGSNLPTASTAVSHLYVSDVHGSDSNSGLSSTSPLKTLAAAVALLPPIIRHDVVIHVGAHSGTGYTWATIDGCTLLDGATIYVYGDGAGQSGEDGFTTVLASTAALAGSTNEIVKNTGMTVDTYLGATVEILTGAAAGDRRTIIENTATNIVPTTKFTAAVAENDTYRIVTPAVMINVPPNTTGTTVLCANIGAPRSGGRPLPTFHTTNPQLTTQAKLVLVNLNLNAQSGFWNLESQNSLVVMIGVKTSSGRFFTSGETVFGETDFGRTAAPTLTTSTTAWHGWTLYTSTILFFGGGSLYGMIVGVRLTLCDGELSMFSGRFTGGSLSVPTLNIGSNNGNPILHLGSTSATAYTYFKAENTGTIIGSSLGKLQFPSITRAGGVILSSSAGGTGILLDNLSVCDLTSLHMTAGGFSLTTSGWGVSVRRGSRLIIENGTDGYIQAGSGSFTLDEHTGITSTQLNGDGRRFAASADGSTIFSADTYSAT